MFTYSVSYYLGNMYHSYLLDADNEAEAIGKAIGKLLHPEVMHDFKIKRHVPAWN